MHFSPSASNSPSLPISECFPLFSAYFFPEIIFILTSAKNYTHNISRTEASATHKKHSNALTYRLRLLRKELKLLAPWNAEPESRLSSSSNKAWTAFWEKRNWKEIVKHFQKSSFSQVNYFPTRFSCCCWRKSLHFWFSSDKLCSKFFSHGGKSFALAQRPERFQLEAQWKLEYIIRHSKSFRWNWESWERAACNGGKCSLFGKWLFSPFHPRKDLKRQWNYSEWWKENSLFCKNDFSFFCFSAVFFCVSTFPHHCECDADAAMLSTLAEGKVSISVKFTLESSAISLFFFSFGSDIVSWTRQGERRRGRKSLKSMWWEKETRGSEAASKTPRKAQLLRSTWAHSLGIIVSVWY